ncbi:MAG: fructose-bisphosphate aldolase [Thaumarchaeota archaeon]|nr:fructose-bisphosphate aldolase [Nitrososphaerota archaeon]
MIIMTNIKRNEKILAVTLDHGLTIGPVSGLIDINGIVDDVRRGGASAIVTHKGFIKNLDTIPDIGKIIHLSASTSLSVFPDDKVLVGNPETAMNMGADAVSIHVNIGSSHDQRMIKDLGMIVDQCKDLELPVLAMMYPRGEKVSNPFDPEVVAHVARIGAELGADVVKTLYTGNPDTFKTVVEGCPVPVIIAGGPKSNTDDELLNMVKGAMDSGAVGVAMGRNIFQHSHPENITRAISNIIFDNSSVESALEVI